MRAAQFNSGERVNALAENGIVRIPDGDFKREFAARAPSSPGFGEHFWKRLHIVGVIR